MMGEESLAGARIAGRVVLGEGSLEIQNGSWRGADAVRMDLLMEQSARLGACSVSGSPAAPATSPTCVQLFLDTECLRIPFSVRGQCHHPREYRQHVGPFVVLGTRRGVTLHLHSITMNRHYCYPYFIGEKTEAQRGQ